MRQFGRSNLLDITILPAIAVYVNLKNYQQLIIYMPTSNGLGIKMNKNTFLRIISLNLSFHYGSFLKNDLLKLTNMLN